MRWQPPSLFGGGSLPRLLRPDGLCREALGVKPRDRTCATALGGTELLLHPHLAQQSLETGLGTQGVQLGVVDR